MSYVVLARKYRPQSFEDLVGQEHVSTTIQNAVTRGRVAHAFLFTGVRGVGKTTSARILAKTLNCERGPTAKPCQVCPACVEITAGNDVDVQEIDAASYTGVDDVRKLQESLPYRPSRDRFKIFIVDEVHMLSVNAWNAFLKTLEEPPPHVKFIFATTEVHKVPVTILSRCQRYDFKLLSAQTIAARLRYVLEQERIAAEEAAISTLAREAAGSMRDAMSLLDQVIAWVGVSGDKITAEGVARVLGVADRTVLHRLCNALVEGDAAECLRIVGELAGQGYDLPHVARDILSHLRDLVVAKVCENPAGLLDLSDEEIADVKALAAHASAEDLTRLHQAFSRSFDEIVRGGQPRSSLEMALVRIARRPPLLPVDELLRRLTELERRLAGSGPSQGSGGGGSSERGPGRGAPPQGSGRRPPAQASASAPDAANTSPVNPINPGDAAFRPAASPRETSSSSSRASQSTPAPAADGPKPTPEGTGPPPSPAPPPPPRAPEASPLGFAGMPAPAARAPSRPARAPSPASTPTPTPTTAPQRLPDTAGPQASPATAGPQFDAWRATVDLMRATHPRQASLFDHAVLMSIESDRIVISFDQGNFLSDQASDASTRELLISAARRHFGRPMDIVIESSGENASFVRGSASTKTIAGAENSEKRARINAAKKAVAEHPLVLAAIEFLGAELKEVRLPAEYNEN